MHNSHLVVAVISFVLGYVDAANNSVTNQATSLSLFFQNNLNGTDDVNHFPFLLLDPTTASEASGECQAVGETLLNASSISSHVYDFERTFAYLCYSGYPYSQFQIQNAIVTLKGTNGQFSISGHQPPGYSKVPVLCTDSYGKGLTVKSNTNTYNGYRSEKAFTFLGIPFADPAARFTYSKLYSGQNQVIDATVYPPQCAQQSSGSEDCLYLDIWSPYLPKQGSQARLKPVFFWIHGGGFTGGNGRFDGSNMASREDIVFVSIQYRLSTLGFLAVPGTDIKGNYGIADQITALEWVRQNIAAFGGDPSRITIVGESAGAGSVRVLLGSPPAINQYRAAIAMSNLGGGVDLGLTGDYSTTYSSYLTIAQAYAASEALFAQAGCNQSTVEAQITCIEAVPALTLVGLPTVARYVVQDGYYVDTEQLIVSVKNASTAHVPVMFGNLADDGASFVNYPKTPVTSELSGLQSIVGISEAYAQSIISSGLFPFPNTGNLTLDTFNVSARIYTDAGFRCIDQSTVYTGVLFGAFPSAYYYQFDRAIAGYDPNNVGTPPADASHPLGDPALPYFKVHAGDLEFALAEVPASAYREPQDLYFEQLTSGYWAEFVKSLQPNPPEAYLIARGYKHTLEATQTSGRWQAVGRGSVYGPIQRLDWPPVVSSYLELEQCAFLNYSLTYYATSNRG